MKFIDLNRGLKRIFNVRSWPLRGVLIIDPHSDQLPDAPASQRSGSGLIFSSAVLATTLVALIFWEDHTLSVDQFNVVLRCLAFE